MESVHLAELLHKFGREKELELIRNVIRHTSTSFSRHFSASKGFITILSSGSQDAGTAVSEDRSESLSSQSESSNTPAITNDNNPKPPQTRGSSAYEQSSAAMSLSPTLSHSDGLRRAAFRTKSRVARAQAVLIVGPPGSVISDVIYWIWNSYPSFRVGKSSMILANQAKWRCRFCSKHLYYMSRS